MKTLLLGAMPEEIKAFAGWDSVQTALIGVGKTSAAMRCQKAICDYRPDIIIFTGVAGALDSALAIGDIGIGYAAIDADFDVSRWNPDYARGEMPFGQGRVVMADENLVALAKGSQIETFDAYIATGSKFLDTVGKGTFIEKDCPALATVFDDVGCLMPNIYEMEGVAVLATAKFNAIPALAIRVISDTVSGDAPEDFNNFIAGSIDHYVQIVEHIIDNI